MATVDTPEGTVGLFMLDARKIGVVGRFLRNLSKGDGAEESSLIKNLISLGRWQAGKGADDAALAQEGEITCITSENLERVWAKMRKKQNLEGRRRQMGVLRQTEDQAATVGEVWQVEEMYLVEKEGCLFLGEWVSRATQELVH